MAKLSRTKGNAFERTIANLLKCVWPDSRRGVLQVRAGDECADVEGTPWWVECKCGKKPSPWAALKQAKEASDGRPPVLFLRKDKQGTLVAMDLADWLDLAERAERYPAVIRGKK